MMITNNMIPKKRLLSVYATNQGLQIMDKKDVKLLDLLNVAFGYIEDGVITLEQLHNLNRIKEFKEWNPDLKIYLSLASGKNCSFGEGIRTKEGLEKLTDSMIDIVRKWELDGLDIDWEYPSGEEERLNHTVLLKTLREKLDKIEDGKKHGLSIAAGTKSWYFTITQLTESVKYLDYVNLMTYDINANSLVTIHHSCPLKMDTDLIEEGSTEENIELFLKKGVPKEKLIIGAAFYSRQWHNVENKKNGLHSYSGEKSDYGPIYTQLKEGNINKNGYTRYWDEHAKAPYLFNGNNFITYEDEESLWWKCKLVKDWDIAGIMAWEYSCDKEHELLTVMRKALD